MLTPGTSLQNRYRIKHLLGSGGEGAVYFARDERSNIDVALKECIIIDDRLLRQFERVARLLATLEHPALPKVYTHFSENNTQFLVMEYIAGDDLLQTRAKRGSQFSTDEVLEWANQLLDALEYLHSQQPPIIHRDIKPQNIKLAANGKVVLLDFGLSKHDASSVGIGTLSYAPLEQILGQGTDARSDLYSLAASLYQLMTGLQAASAWVRFKEPPDRLRPANKVSAAVSPAIAEILNRALSLDRGQRPASASEMRKLLLDARKPPGFIKTSLPSFDFETVTLDSVGNVTDRRKGQARQLIEDLGGGVTLEMVEIPAGSFLMGSPEREAGRYDHEGPQHKVMISQPFYMGKYPVTQSQWRAVPRILKVNMDLPSDPSTFRGDNLPAEEVIWEDDVERWIGVLDYDDNLPAEEVSWEEAMEFCARLSKATGKTYRLPTEAEWEYACRAGTTTPFAFGETITPVIVNYDGNYAYASALKGENRQKTTSVGSLGVANGFGLYDMHGNVWEWCMDWYSGNYYSQSPGTDPKGPDTGSARVMRGGSSLYPAHDCRSAFRRGHTPGYRALAFGFRLLRTYD